MLKTTCVSGISSSIGWVTIAITAPLVSIYLHRGYIISQSMEMKFTIP
jgi:hypothetical protein